MKTRCALMLTAVVVATALASLTACAPASGPVLETGAWRGWLESPGGELPFDMRIDPSVVASTFDVKIRNGEEIIDLTLEAGDEGRITIPIPHYDARIEGFAGGGGNTLSGEWIRATSRPEPTRLPFHARAGQAPRFEPIADADASVPNDAFDGRWAVSFADDEDLAIGLFRVDDDGSATGTFVTPTGDYRFLAGRVDGRTMRLSTFDGAHAFLVTATLEDDETLSGEFWSRDTYHADWTAYRDDEAALPDAFEMVAPRPNVELSTITYETLDGETISLADPSLDGEARIVEVFGTWCPNCHDSAKWLAELHERYGPRGLSIIGVALELPDDPEHRAELVRTFAERHDIDYPLLLGGQLDRDRSGELFPLLERVPAYPTAVFLDGEGNVVDVHVGFAGPATGEAHTRLRAAFTERIESLLADDDAAGGAGSDR